MTVRDQDLRRALEALDGAPRPCPARSWPCHLAGVDEPGLYSWWIDRAGAAELSRGLGHEVQPGRIYAGQAGARRGQAPGESTLASRIEGNHLGGRSRTSTFRFTLAAVLYAPCQLEIAGPKRLDYGSEKRLTKWMRSHLEVAVFAFRDRERLRGLEDAVLERLDPPLNLQKRSVTALRSSLGFARAKLALGQAPWARPPTP